MLLLRRSHPRHFVVPNHFLPRLPSSGLPATPRCCPVVPAGGQRQKTRPSSRRRPPTLGRSTQLCRSRRRAGTPTFRSPPLERRLYALGRGFLRFGPSTFQLQASPRARLL